MDHVVMADGRIYRVVGNLDHPAKFVGYNVYSPNPVGDRVFRGMTYRKNFTEDYELPQDALDTYVMLPKVRICEHLDPRIALHRLLHGKRRPVARERVRGRRLPRAGDRPRRRAGQRTPHPAHRGGEPRRCRGTRHVPGRTVRRDRTWTRELRGVRTVPPRLG